MHDTGIFSSADVSFLFFVCPVNRVEPLYLPTGGCCRQSALNPYQAMGRFKRRQIGDIFFQENKIWHIMQIVSLENRIWHFMQIVS